jgi:hypothetical protein
MRTPQRAGHSSGYAHLEQKLYEQKLQVHNSILAGFWPRLLAFSCWPLALSDWSLAFSLDH